MKRTLSFTSALLFGWLAMPLFAQEVVLSDDFESGALAPHWSFDQTPFETGAVDIGGGLVDGTMRLEVTAFSDFWGGFALRTERTFSASVDDPLSYQVTRVADEGIGITRSGAWIMNSDRSQYVFVSQNIGEGGWQYNRRIGQEGDSATGAGVNIEAFDALDEDFGEHVIRLVANGSTVQIFLNDELGAEVDFPLTEGIVFGFGSYVRSTEDDGVASFDDVEIKSDLPTGLPCVTLTAPQTALFAGTSAPATLTAPRLYVADSAASVTITSDNPEVATLEGADANGSLTINFNAGGESSRPLTILTGKGGSANFSLTASDPLCVGGALGVTVSSAIILNPSFEDSPRPEGVGYGDIEGWLGGSGINDGGPFGDNGMIPDRAQIAFNQGNSELSQDIAGLDPSKLYHVQFYYNARNCCGGTIDLSVNFDDQKIGETVENIQPVGGTKAYHVFSGSFQPASDSGTFMISTVAEGDATALFDAVSVTERSIDDLLLKNPSFEASGRGLAFPGYLPAMAGWTVVGNAGVNVGGEGPFADNGETPDQDVVAFIQNAGSSISQELTSFVIGETYTLTYAVNARTGNAPTLRVLLDDVVLSEEMIEPVGAGSPYQSKTVEFTAASVGHTITFAQATEGDQTVLLDNVRILGEASNIPCVPVTPDSLTASIGQTGTAVTIEMPEEALADGPVTITVTTSNPNAFVLTGAGADGSVSLQFAAGGELTQSAFYEAVGKGAATFAISSSKALCFDSTAVTANALASLVRNGGFESNYPEAWPHYGDIDSWSRSGNAGTNRSDGPFHDNGIIPDGAQIGFAQGASVLSQEIGGLVPGESYWLQFYYNRRVDGADATISFQASYGDQVLFESELLEPVGADMPYQYVSIPFVPSAASATLAFTPTVEGDATLLLDAITVVKRAETEIALRNPSFEATGALSLAFPGYLGTAAAPDEALAMAGWVATGSYGVNASGPGPFADNGINPDQDDVVFLQEAGASISQVIGGLTSGETYTLSYAYNARSGNMPTLQVDIDGNLAQEVTVVPVGPDQPYHQHSFSFLASGDTAELLFTQTATGDQTVLIDDVRLVPGGDARPCVTVSPGTLTLEVGASGEIVVRVPDEAFDGVEEVAVTFTSGDANVASVEGTLTFTFGGDRSQTVTVIAGSPGSTPLSITADESVCLSRESVVVTVNAPVMPNFIVSNGSFEANSNPEFPGYGPIEDWVKEGSGNSGLNSAEGPFHNSGVIPDRGQVAFMQNSLTLSQTLVGLEPGASYWLQFYYSARAGEFSRPTLTARIDGQELVVLNLIESVGDGDPYHFVNVTFVAGASTALLQLESFVEEGGDGAVLIDALSVTQRTAEEVVVANPSFEASGLAPAPGYIQPDFIAGWTIEGNYGTNRSGEGPFADNGTNSDQELVLFLQEQANASQVIQGLTAGEVYTLSFAYNGRSGGAPQLIVVADDVVIFDQVVTSVGDAPYLQGRATFTASGPSVSLAFGQVAEGDHTVLLDDIRVVAGESGDLDGLLGYWRFDEGQGNVAADESGRGNHGAIVSPDGVWVDDPTRGSVYQSGGGSFVELGNLPVIGLETDFTWSFWVNADETDNTTLVFGNRWGADGVDFAPREFVKFTPRTFEWHVGGAPQNVPGENTMLVIGEWAHNLLVKSGTTLTYYRDGVELATSEITAAPANAQPLYLGGQDGLENFSGKFDEVAIFSRALSVDEVADVYSRGLNGQALTSGDPVVEGPLPSLTNVGIQASGSFGLTLPEGVTADVEYSTDLSVWEVIAAGVTGAFEETDGERLAAPAGYYRAKQ